MLINRVLTLTTLLAASAAPSAVLAAETLYVAGNGGSTQKAFEENIIPAFEAMTGADVVYVPASSADIVAKLVAQQGNQELSLVMIDSGPMTRAAGQNLCTPLPKIPVLEDLYPSAIMPGGTAVGWGFYATGFGYNKDVFAQNGWEAPTSWFDLGDAKYKGRVVVGIVSGYGVETLAMLAHAGGGSVKDIEPAFEFMAEKVSPNVLAWEGAPATVSQMLQTGEAALVVLGNHRVQAVIDQGAPVDFVYPKEGARQGMVTTCLVEGAPQAELAAQFMEWILSPDAQVQIAQNANFGPTNSKVELEGDLADKVVYGQDKVNQLVPTDWSTIQANLDGWTQRWNREVER